MTTGVVNNQVIFKDGHREDITYFERWTDTKTYVRAGAEEYLYERDETLSTNVFSKYHIELDKYVECDEIAYIIFDHEVFNNAIIKNHKIPTIKDSGNRREFESGAVRDIQEGKGRCDLMPLDVIGLINGCGDESNIFKYIHRFQRGGGFFHLIGALETFVDLYYDHDMFTMYLEVAKHFEDGAKKYGENNWQKGIPVRCYIDSATRHLIKYMRGDTDEPHNRAFCWNVICAIWTCRHMPELNEYGGDESNHEEPVLRYRD